MARMMMGSGEARVERVIPRRGTRSKVDATLRDQTAGLENRTHSTAALNMKIFVHSDACHVEIRGKGDGLGL